MCLGHSRQHNISPTAVPSSNFESSCILFPESVHTGAFTLAHCLGNVKYFQLAQNMPPFEGYESQQRRYPKINERLNMFCGVVHPMHLFRFCERCRFEESIPDDVLVEVLEEVHDYNENSDENSSEEEEERNGKRRKKTLTEKAEWIREEEGLYLEEEILELFRGRLNQVGVEDDTEDGKDECVVDLKFCNLKDDRDMMRYILEFIGHAKTIINFACACRLTSEVFKQANANNELVKRLARDLGLVVFVLPANHQRITKRHKSVGS